MVQDIRVRQHGRLFAENIFLSLSFLLTSQVITFKITTRLLTCIVFLCLISPLLLLLPNFKIPIPFFLLFPHPL